MKVDIIHSSLSSLVSIKKAQRSRNVQQEAKTDKMDISREVRQMVQKKKALSPDRIQEIRRRIQEGFYDRDEILREVAERILNDRNFRDLMKSPRVDKSL